MRIYLFFFLILNAYQFGCCNGQFDSVPEDVNSRLLIAAYNEDFNGIMNCLNAGANINVSDETGKTALCLLVEKNNIRLVKLMVDKGADLNVVPKPEFGLPPLLTSAKYGYLDITKFLLEKNARINLKNSQGLSAIHYAALYNDTLLYDVLIKNGANPMDMTFGGESPLLLAALNGSYQIIDKLINAGSDVNIQDKKGFTPLMVASQNGQLTIAIRLLKAWASVNIKNKQGYSALSLAVANGYSDIVDLLLLNGANRKEQNTFAFNPRSIAHVFQNKVIEDSLRHFGMNRNYVPYFHGFSAGVGIYINDKDLFTGLDIRTIDLKSKVELGIHYLFRPSAVPVLQNHNNVYFQFWERRQNLGLSASRKITLYKDSEIKGGMEPAIRLDLNIGNYRGTKESITENVLFSPELSVFVQYKQSIWALSYHYTSYNIEGLSNWFIGLSVHFAFFQHPPVLNKIITGID